MRSRLGAILILLFIGIAGVLFVVSKQKEEELTFSLEEGESSPEFSKKTERATEDRQEKKEEKPPEENEEKTIFIHVCGEVKKEGVYELPEGSRVSDAVTAAKGFTKKASRTAVNLAERLSDGMQVRIPETEEETRDLQTAGSVTVSRSGGKIDINRASKEELMTLTGIGQARAEDILRYREEIGRFQKIEDIMKVKGIKQGSFEKIKDKITV